MGKSGDAGSGSAFLAGAALALSMALVGANVPLAKYLGAHLPLVWIGIVRCGVSVAALLPLLIVHAFPSPAGAGAGRGIGDQALSLSPFPSQWEGGKLAILLGLAALGLTGVFLYPAFLVTGLKSTGALAAGAIAATLPAMVALLSMIFLRERLTFRQAAGIGAAIVALLALNMSSASGVGESSLAGNALILLAVAAEASYVVIARRVAQSAGPILMAAGANVAGLVAFILLGLVQGALMIPQAPAAAWWGAAWFGITSSVLALILWFWGVARVRAMRAGVFTVFLPLTAGAVAILFLNERPSLLMLAGVGAVIAAILLTAERGDQRSRLPLA